MSIKILGGLARGFTLATPHESITRPTSVLLKRRLFDYFQNLSGYHFIDLCAGSGSMGLEALSRGADSATFIESNPKAFKVLQTNTKAFIKKYEAHINDVSKLDFSKWLIHYFLTYESLSDEEKESHILFFDPPYEKPDLYEKFFYLLKENNFKGIVIIEACRQKTLPEKDFQEKYGEPDRNYQQGTSFLYLYDYN